MEREIDFQRRDTRAHMSTDTRFAASERTKRRDLLRVVPASCRDEDHDETITDSITVRDEDGIVYDVAFLTKEGSRNLCGFGPPNG